MKVSKNKNSLYGDTSLTRYKFAQMVDNRQRHERVAYTHSNWTQCCN